MRFLVTGASGFLGRHLTVALLARGDEVVALGRRADPALEERGVRQVTGDVRDGAAVERALAKCAGVLHCAGFVSHDRRDAETLWQVHVAGTRAVLAAARRRRVARVVVAGTSGTVAVSRTPEVIDESGVAPLPVIASWPYYRAKLFAEQAALEDNGDGLEVVCVNPSLLLGPGDLRRGSTEVVRRFLERRIPAVPAGGLSFVDARDAAAAMVSALERGAAGERYLLGAVNLTWRGFFDRLARLSGVPAPFMPLPLGPGLARAAAELLEAYLTRRGRTPAVSAVELEMAQHYWYCESSKAERVLGFAPRDPNDTLRDTIDDVRARAADHAGVGSRPDDPREPETTDAGARAWPAGRGLRG